MKTYSPEELQAVLRAHLAWLRNEVNGERADLRCADLRDADLRDADLRDANLSDAKEMDSAIMPGGYTFAQYKAELVPALLTAGGKLLAEVVESSWECHDWNNCPMAAAFSVHSVEEIPLL